MKISPVGLSFIESFEGCYLKAYKCQAGVWTIGIGTTVYPDGSKVESGDVCIREQALMWLEGEIEEKSKYFNHVLETLGFELRQYEYDALVSFFYNLGIGKCHKGSTMGDAIHAKNKNQIADAFLIYNKFRWHGILRVSKGLDRRRKAEQKLFLSGEL